MVVPNSIEREVLIEAPIDVVWSIVTEPEHIGGWFSDSADVDLRPGGELVLRWDQLGTASGTVERVEPPNLFSFRWVAPEPDRDPAIREGFETLVEFRLRSEGDGTLLQLVESGFAGHAASEQENAELAERHRGGWGAFLGRLVEHVSAVELSA